VGWALLIAVAVITTARTRWRWLAVLYPVMTTLAVVVTANHFWLDGIVSATLLVIVLTVQGAIRRHGLRIRIVRRQPAPAEAAPDGALPERLETGTTVTGGGP
jgi:hypothetical protein